MLVMFSVRTGRRLVLSLRSDLEAWDVKDIPRGHAILDAHRDTRGFVSRVIRLSAEESVQPGATWLLKQFCVDEEGSISASQVDSLCAILSSLNSWGGQLHVLQCLHRVTLRPSNGRAIASFLDTLVWSDNKFVRAWALSAYAELASQLSRYQDDARDILHEAAQADQAASVRARLRAVFKNHPTLRS